MKTYLGKNARLLTIVFCLLCSACATPVDIDETATPPPATPGPKIDNYEGVASFSGGAGNYVVECENCSATVVSTVVCQQYKFTDGWDSAGEYSYVIPVVSIAYNGNITNQNNLTTSTASGHWVISNQTLPYTKIISGQLRNSKCPSEAVFTILMSSGGTVTELP